LNAKSYHMYTKHCWVVVTVLDRVRGVPSLNPNNVIPYKVLVAIFTCGPCESDTLQLDRLVSHKLEHEEVVAAGERERVCGGRPGDAGHQLTGADGGAAIPDLQEV